MKRIAFPTFIKRIVFPTLAVMAAATIVLRFDGAPKPSAMMSVQEMHEKTDLKKLPVEEFEDQSLVFPRAARR